MPQIKGKQIADATITEVQIASTSFGDGITGGSGSSIVADLEAAGAGTGGLAFDAGEIRVDAGPGIELTASGVEVDIEAAGAGTGGLAFNTNVLRVLAGNGIELAAGGVTVTPDVTTGGDTAAVSVGANGVGIDVGTLDGDHLDIDFTPSNYTPATTPAEAADVDDLAAHLYGIDQALGASVDTAIMANADHELTPAASAGSDDFDTTLAIAGTPLGQVEVFINGVAYIVGDGSKVKDCYFTGDTGTTARAMTAIVATDELYFNPTIAGFDLETSDRISILYET